MIEPRFRSAPAVLDLARLVELSGARAADGAAGRRLAITGVAALDWAGPSDIACAAFDPAEGSDVAILKTTDAGACLATAAAAAFLPRRTIALVTDDPRSAFAKVASALFPESARPEAMFGTGVAPGATVHPAARLEPGVTVDPGAVIGPGAEIGGGAVICANAVIGQGVRIGRDSVIGPGATVAHSLIGDRVIVQPGASIGATALAAEMQAHLQPSLGRVILQDDVTIGANAAIARGRRRDTVVGEGGRVDALARIAADVLIGRLSLVYANVPLPEGASAPDFSICGIGDENRMPIKGLSV